MTSPHIIPLDRAKLGGLLVLSLIFVALGGWMLTVDLGDVVSVDGDLDRVITITIGMMSILFFGPAAALIAYKFFDRKPGLVLSEDGFTDNSSVISAGFVPWSDVVKLKNYDISGQRSLMIAVRDPEKYIKRYGPLRRMFVRANQRWYGGPIGITANTLRIRQSELYALFQAHLDAYAQDGTT